jgi:hypothetical protein
VACSVVPHRRARPSPGPALSALKVTFDLFRPNEGKTAVKGLSIVVDQLSIIVKVFLNSSPGPQCSDLKARAMPRGVRIVFHGDNATPVPELQKAGSQLIALPGCRSTDHYCQHGPSPRAGKGSRAEETRDRKPRRTLGLKGPRTDPGPVNCERFSFDSRMVGTAIWGFCDERGPARVPER